MVGIFSACGTASRLPQRNAPPVAPSKGEPNLPEAQNTKKDEATLPSATIVGTKGTASTLLSAYNEWKGTPYKWGGVTASGIDCSAFMQIVFADYLNINLPRTTQKQIYTGRTVKRNRLRTGDLVFFKTGRKTLHVGVIIDNPRFLHASTSEGVTISSLNDYYWRSRFLTAKRVMR